MTDIDSARRAAWTAAQRLCGGDSKTAGMVIREVQLDVLRALISKTLPGGEMEFWELVRKEIP